ncbi:GFA family protein [Pelagibacterium sp. 26DY04]|uniref:GFA family protein n=1 Tax=Pelagibacterium sp. 26DY04 TaxID=2967130 RepID=UPI002816951C|nr:GFA family protein [Pelagibacterium sp. 26DY04]WMT88141.1 GFA family protein [Pelagibacterium sp. 26DY04]
MADELTGGCQCGAVRFSTKLYGRGSICHCRMCQKAFGSFFGPLVTAHDGTWTRGEPKWFQSSNAARRAFCADCGTPLAYQTKFGLELAIGAFDQPERVPPEIQVNPHDKVPFFESLSQLPLVEDPGEEWRNFMAGIHSNQHPDHDTSDWPPREEEEEEL